MSGVARHSMNLAWLWAPTACIAIACGKEVSLVDATTTPPAAATPAVEKDDATPAVENDVAVVTTEKVDTTTAADSDIRAPKASAPPAYCDFGTLGAESPEALMRQVLLTVKEKPGKYPSIIKALRPERCAYFGALWEFRDSRAADAFDAWNSSDALPRPMHLLNMRPNTGVVEFATGDVDLLQVQVSVKRTFACVESAATRHEICQFMLEIPSPKGAVTILAAPVLNRWFLLQEPVIVLTPAQLNEQLQPFAEKVRNFKAGIDAAPDHPIDKATLGALDRERQILSTRVLALRLLEPRLRDPSTGLAPHGTGTMDIEAFEQAEKILEDLKQAQPMWAAGFEGMYEIETRDHKLYDITLKTPKHLGTKALLAHLKAHVTLSYVGTGPGSRGVSVDLSGDHVLMQRLGLRLRDIITEIDGKKIPLSNDGTVDDGLMSQLFEVLMTPKTTRLLVANRNESREIVWKSRRTQDRGEQR